MFAHRAQPAAGYPPARRSEPPKHHRVNSSSCHFSKTPQKHTISIVAVDDLVNSCQRWPPPGWHGGDEDGLARRLAQEYRDYEQELGSSKSHDTNLTWASRGWTSVNSQLSLLSSSSACSESSLVSSGGPGHIPASQCPEPFSEPAGDELLLPTFSIHPPPSDHAAASKVIRESPGSSAYIRGLGTLLPLPVTMWHSQTLWNSRLIWLVLYFSFNLFLTLSNKSVLTGFPFPYTLTAIHALVSSMGGYILRSRGFYTSKRLSMRSEAILALFSILYAVNIAVSNVSLNLVTVPFHQIVRATTPVFITVLSFYLLGARFGTAKLLTLVPVMLGVALATYGDYYFTVWGLFLTLLGTFLAALKTIYANVLQSSPRPATPDLASTSPHSYSRTCMGPVKGSRYHSDGVNPIESRRNPGLLTSVRAVLPTPLALHPLDLLTRMSPLAFIQCVILAQLTGELERVRHFSAWHPPLSSQSLPILANSTDTGATSLIVSGLSGAGGRMDLAKAALLLCNGCIAFGLNVVSLTANGKVGPLSMTVAANIKQVLTILFAVSLFDLTITPTNALGIAVTLAGGAWYAWVDYVDKKNRKRTETPA